MTQLYQAGVGPSQNKVHIRRLGDDPKLSLCESVVIARDYRADIVVDHPVMCTRCWRKFCDEFTAATCGERDPDADDLGVSEIKFMDQQP